MKYRVTCLTPTLVGDGQKLSPIDYMVWKDHVNVLDQKRIFKLLAKGPRLDGYLAQVKKAETLDFASWGGFAQNFAGRRIPFENAGLTPVWNKQRAESLFIPTFASGPAGPYLPASALRGALHTALLASRWTEHAWKHVQDQFQGDRLPRRPAEPAEDTAIGLGGHSRMRAFSVGDSATIPTQAMKVYLVRTSTLVARGQGKLELGWKPAPVFCEMAEPGAIFEGNWSESKFLAQPETLRSLRWKEPVQSGTLAKAANDYAANLLAIHRRYAATAGLTALDANLQHLENWLTRVRDRQNACLLPIGWGTGFLAKTAQPDTDQDAHRKLLRLMPFYSRAIQTGLPFPKTRRVVFLNDQPAALPGWILLEIS
ncbi:MAG: type III-A CRISPR-associated RAMP protein Csm5 [Acidobacteria bacterium]|nr:type III-A CRISPR-associated RAMP protein Csm5 [Acidobacteriota bacterium]